MITEEQLRAQKEFQEQKRKLETDILDIQKRVRVIKRNDNKIRRFLESFSGKSKVDLYFEKLVDTPRKRVLLKNKAIHVVSKEYFAKHEERITNDITFYLEKCFK
ncbi:hypothetical protein LCGC14_0494860 [marine sediment metagenome]|uniref:Uncharacterized protein n=1 Tax=marine sediment metagenome TaxID=412755 RepID=A0A0F9SAI0_9ZZZZ